MLDVMMPRMDSSEDLKRLKAEARTQSIPVVMLTLLAQVAELLKSR